MDILKGLSIDGVKYFSEITSGQRKPEWMDFTAQISKLSGNRDFINLASGIGNLESFLFKTPKWPIGGVYFDGIMRTEHTSKVRATQYPVQTGVVMTDHAIIEPAELSIEIMMTDCRPATVLNISHNQFLDTVYEALKRVTPFANFAYIEKDVEGDGRSMKTWSTLKAMQIARMPMVVETRLGTYNNMLIEELSAPDDAKTMHALKCNVRLREIIVACVAETKVSARAAASKNVSGGQTPAKTGEVDTLAHAMKKGAGF